MDYGKEDFVCRVEMRNIIIYDCSSLATSNNGLLISLIDKIRGLVYVLNWPADFVKEEETQQSRYSKIFFFGGAC